jgi:hypothetical protein
LLHFGCVLILILFPSLHLQIQSVPLCEPQKVFQFNFEEIINSGKPNQLDGCPEALRSGEWVMVDGERDSILNGVTTVSFPIT